MDLEGKVADYINAEQSQSVDTWQGLVVGSPPLVGGLLCPLWLQHG